MTNLGDSSTITVFSQSGWDQPSFSEVRGCKGATPDEAVAKYMEVCEIAARHAD